MEAGEGENWDLVHAVLQQQAVERSKSGTSVFPGDLRSLGKGHLGTARHVEAADFGTTRQLLRMSVRRDLAGSLTSRQR